LNVIPAIDLQGGKCVRLLKGDFSKTTEYSDDPVAVAREFSELRTSDLHIVDLDGARSGTQANRAIVESIAAESDLSIQLGGGIRDKQAVSDWLSAGVERCIIGSLTVTEPDAVKSWLVQFGGERIVLALDVNINEEGTPLITTHGWTQPSNTSIFECIEDYRNVGLQHVLCTDISRDGAMEGPNVQLYASIMGRFPDLKLQASGGVRDINDLEELRQYGIPAAITGKALLEGKITNEEMRSFQRNA
jgi:phosphoribosylformimino-5-aminoimidazole carboxamide ribotide isomerase